jgi:hypothetical protein
MANETFRASVPGPVQFPSLGVMVNPYPLPLDRLADALMQVLKSYATDVTLLSDTPSRLRDGTPRREIEFKMVVNGVPWNFLNVATKKDDTLIHTVVRSTTGKIGEDLKAIPYSLEFQPGKDEPVKVPPDIQEFIDRWSNDIVSHDVAKVMSYYSDRFLDSGNKKGEIERFHRQTITSTMSFEMYVIDFVAAGDKAYLAGFDSVNGARWPLRGTSIIRENGEWKWYGNQRNPAP